MVSLSACCLILSRLLLLDISKLSHLKKKKMLKIHTYQSIDEFHKYNTYYFLKFKQTFNKKKIFVNLTSRARSNAHSRLQLKLTPHSANSNFNPSVAGVRDPVL